MADEICSYKMFFMSITLKNSPSQFSYSLCYAQLNSACHQKYLVVYVTSTLSWQLQCDEAKKKAVRVLGILQRNLSSCKRSVKACSYLSLLMHPIVEYATVVWSLPTNKGIAVMPTLPLFCLVSCSPALVNKSPAFYVHYKYWILSKTENRLSLRFSPFLAQNLDFLIRSMVSGAFLRVFSQWQRLFLASKWWFRILIVCKSCLIMP